MRAAWGSSVVVLWLAVGCDAGAPAPEGPPPDEVKGPLCLEALPERLAFEAEHPGDAREATLRVATCDGTAWHAELDVDGDGFVALQRVVSPGAGVRASGRALDVGAGEHIEADVTYLGRTLDDGAEGAFIVRGVAVDGRVGQLRVVLSGQVLTTCAECGCCDETVDPDLPTWGAGGGSPDPETEEPRCDTCNTKPSPLPDP